MRKMSGSFQNDFRNAWLQMFDSVGLKKDAEAIWTPGTQTLVALDEINAPVVIPCTVVNGPKSIAPEINCDVHPASVTEVIPCTVSETQSIDSKINLDNHSTCFPAAIPCTINECQSIEPKNNLDTHPSSSTSEGH